MVVLEYEYLLLTLRIILKTILITPDKKITDRTIKKYGEVRQLQVQYEVD